jgi:hypothetical protein
MTIMAAINLIDVLKPNTFEQSEKIRWLSILDGIVKTKIIDTHEGAEDVVFRPYDENTALTQELLIPHPYDDVYIRWMDAQIDYANVEYDKYNNSITTYNAAYLAFERYYNRTHKPITKRFTHF